METTPEGNINLSSAHLQILTEESGISTAVLAARGYETATTKKRLKELGFAAAQQRVPALVLPLHGTTGDVAGYQIRPDDPRWLDGKAIKYETPRGFRMRLDVPSTVRQHLGNPGIPLFITEGVKKGDSLASLSTDEEPLCVVALLGVWNWRGTNEQGGKTLLPDWESVALNGRRVFIVFDGDVAIKREVHGALARLVPALAQRGAQVRCVYLPQMLNGQKCGVDDFLVSGKTLVDVLDLAEPLRKPPADEKDHRPEILITTEIGQVVDAMEQAILKAPGGPYLYQRSRLLSFVARGVQAPRGLDRQHDTPVIARASQAKLMELAATHGKWFKANKRAGVWEPGLPPSWCAQVLEARQEWRFPRLEGILSTPTLRLDGSILEKSGYDQHTGLFLDTNGADFPAIPPRPSLVDARTALDTLREPFADFCFQSASDFSVALAAVLSLIARYAIRGNVPLFAISSPTRASGKGLLVDVITTLATGRPAAKWAETTDPEEERKRLLTIALEGDAAIVLDNLTQPLGSAPLDMALTTGTTKDRLLGSQTSKEAAINAVFFATGNNLRYAGDMARRVVPCHLDPGIERPEERTGFTHPDLLAWVNQERPQLVVAGLTVLRAYHIAGKPKQEISALGSFDGWSDLIRAALVWTGEADPASGRADIEVENDQTYEDLNQLLHYWYERFGEESQTLNEVIDKVNNPPADKVIEWGELKSALAGLDNQGDGKLLNVRSIGKSLKKHIGRVVGNLRLQKAGMSGHRILWKVEFREFREFDPVSISGLADHNGYNAKKVYSQGYRIETPQTHETPHTDPDYEEFTI